MLRRGGLISFAAARKFSGIISEQLAATTNTASLKKTRWVSASIRNSQSRRAGASSDRQDATKISLTNLGGAVIKVRCSHHNWRGVIKVLIFALVVVVLMAFTPRSTPAQSCCGELEQYLVDCQEDCGQKFIYGCNAQAGNTFMAPATVQCGSFAYCNRVGTYVPAGNCLDAATFSSRVLAPDAKAGFTAYVNAYVLDCTGRFVAVRMAFDRDLT